MRSIKLYSTTSRQSNRRYLTDCDGPPESLSEDVDISDLDPDCRGVGWVDVKAQGAFEYAVQCWAEENDVDVEIIHR